MTSEELKKRNLDRVLQTLFELCLRYGIDNTTKEMVARASGISRASVSRYFSSKTDSIMQMSEWIGSRLCRRNSHLGHEMASGQYTGAEMLMRYMDAVKTLFYETPNLFVLLTEIKTFLFRNCDDSQTAYKRVHDVFGSRAVLAGIFSLGMQDGSFPRSLDADREAERLIDIYCSYLAKLAIHPSPTAEGTRAQTEALLVRVAHLYETSP